MTEVAEDKSTLEKYLTWPNAMSMTGLGLSVDGARRLDTFSGVAEATVGRLLDLGDGKIARLTGQTSEVGAIVDAAADKAAITAIGTALWRNNSAPKPILAAMAVQNAFNVIATFYDARRTTVIDKKPSDEGKLAMAWQNAAIGAYALSGPLIRGGYTRSARVVRSIGHATAAVGTGYYGLSASMVYAGRAISSRRTET